MTALDIRGSWTSCLSGAGSDKHEHSNEGKRGLAHPVHFTNNHSSNGSLPGRTIVEPLFRTSTITPSTPQKMRQTAWGQTAPAGKSAKTSAIAAQHWLISSVYVRWTSAYCRIPVSGYTGDMSAVKDRLHERIERMEPSQLEEAVRVLEPKLVEKPVVYSDRELRRQKSSEWLCTHDEEMKHYRGKWILLEGHQLLAVDDDYEAVSRRADEVGIEVPFIYRVPPNDLPFAGF
jgi:hypothetical protein